MSGPLCGIFHCVDRNSRHVFQFELGPVVRPATGSTGDGLRQAVPDDPGLCVFAVPDFPGRVQRVSGDPGHQDPREDQCLCQCVQRDTGSHPDLYPGNGRAGSRDGNAGRGAHFGHDLSGTPSEKTADILGKIVPTAVVGQSQAAAQGRGSPSAAQPVPQPHVPGGGPRDAIDRPERGGRGGARHGDPNLPGRRNRFAGAIDGGTDHGAQRHGRALRRGEPNHHRRTEIRQGDLQPPDELGLCAGLCPGIAANTPATGDVQGHPAAGGPGRCQASGHYCERAADHQRARLYRRRNHDWNRLVSAAVSEHPDRNTGMPLGTLVLPAKGGPHGSLVGIRRLQSHSVGGCMDSPKNQRTSFLAKNFRQAQGSLVGDVRSFTKNTNRLQIC
mmetsp:Transcript_23110/g.64079  ORF Transcript_23110/g.64079 Transcript_23110/m.64079 type:complete len:387 (+) Transcript_23110:974-2134(+)